MKKSEFDLERLIKKHGEVIVCADGPDGPGYTLADGTHVFIPLDGSEPVVIRPNCRDVQ